MKPSKYFIPLLITSITTIIQATGSPIVLPLKFNTGNKIPNPATNLPSTIIIIQGQKVPLLLDSGESEEPLTISKKTLKTFKYKMTNKKICGHDVANKKTCFPIVIINNIKIGNKNFNNVKTLVMNHLWGGHDKNFILTQAAKNGAIGYKMLARFNVLLDYQQSKAILYTHKQDPIKYRMKSWITFPFQNNLLSKFEYKGNPIKMRWDTGAVPSTIDNKIANIMTRKPCPGIYSTSICAYSTKGTMTPITTQVFPPVWFKQTTIPAISGFNGLIGSNFYAKHLVYFDFSHSKISIK